MTTIAEPAASPAPAAPVSNKRPLETKADGATPMLVASHQGHAEVRALRTVRAPPPRSPHSTTSPTPRPPPRQVVELLIRAGASPTAVAGNTVLSALDIATAAGHARCAALLAAHGACPGMQM